MRIIRQMLDRLGRRETPSIPSVHVPPPLTDDDRRELREAQVRIPRKWNAFDAMIADYGAGDGFYRRRKHK